jgi:glycosyltransferase involved in cell wall biosynthesis
MNIAIDTLFEHPERPSSCIDYLVQVVRMLPQAAPDAKFYVLVSPKNRYWFEPHVRSNVHLVDCFVSNENVPLRIIAQQTIVPWRLKQLKIDILFSPGNVCPLWGSYCRVLKINTLHHYQTPEVTGRVRSLYRTVAFKVSANRADCVLANTRSTHDDIVRLMGIEPNKLATILEASFEQYRPMPENSVLNLCHRYKLSPGYLLFVSTLYPYKGVDTLLRAYKKLLHEQSDLGDLVVLGRDHEGELGRLRILAADLGIESRVHFLGFVELQDLPSFYSGARVFVFPSLMETFGKPLVEAMQCGTPIVASNTSSIPEVVGEAALLVPPGNIEALADAITRAATDEALRRTLIEKGLERGARFSWNESARDIMNVLLRSHDLWKQKSEGNVAISAA